MRLKSNYHKIHVLRSASKKMRKTILAHADKTLILSIIECALNVLKCNCEINSENRKKLIKYKHILRQLCDKSVKLKTKKKGFIIQLLSAVLPTLKSLLTNH